MTARADVPLAVQFGQPDLFEGLGAPYDRIAPTRYAGPPPELALSAPVIARGGIPARIIHRPSIVARVNADAAAEAERRAANRRRVADDVNV
jgi:hypothetical protein